jgi:hypothetical protein
LKDGIVEILAIECVIFFFFFVFTPRYRNWQSYIRSSRNYIWKNVQIEV